MTTVAKVIYLPVKVKKALTKKSVVSGWSENAVVMMALREYLGVKNEPDPMVSHRKRKIARVQRVSK